MWQKAKGCLGSLFLITSFFAAGIFLGMKVANIWFPLDPESNWRLLESSHKFKHIVHVNSHMIWAQTEDGKIYSREIYCDVQLNCDEWNEARTIPVQEYSDAVGEMPMKKGSSCQLDGPRKPETPSGNMAECAQGRYVGMEGGTTAYYTLLDDGTIWVWAEDGSIIENISGILNFLCVMLISIVFCMTASVFFAILRRTRKPSLNSNG